MSKKFKYLMSVIAVIDMLRNKTFDEGIELLLELEEDDKEFYDFLFKYVNENLGNGKSKI